jgi:hypothetical protein
MGMIRNVHASKDVHGHGGRVNCRRIQSTPVAALFCHEAKLIRACGHLSKIATAARWIPARKFLAVLS